MQNLLIYIPCGPAPLNVLTVESSAYLPDLRQRLPNANLFAVAAEIDDAAPYERLGVDFREIDCRVNELPFPPKTFDIIVAEECLTWSYEPFDAVMDISRKLKDTGFVVAAFYNARCHKILRELAAGRFVADGRHFWTKNDVVKIFNDAVFKEIDFAFGERDEANVDKFVEFGFDNFNNDLNTKTWIIKAARSKASVAALKTLYSPAVRRELARILHRIEYDVKREENLSALTRLIEREMIFPEYLHDFIHEVCIHEQRVLNLLP